jgi:hypothetical protein
MAAKSRPPATSARHRKIAPAERAPLRSISRSATKRTGWFTEGFDTPDLKEAKALLDELA